MSDYSILVKVSHFRVLPEIVQHIKNQAKVFLGGPPLVKMATGEEVGEEELGGAAMHSQVSGVSDYLAVNFSTKNFLGIFSIVAKRISCD
jgi:hypothetical protein